MIAARAAGGRRRPEPYSSVVARCSLPIAYEKRALLLVVELRDRLARSVAGALAELGLDLDAYAALAVLADDRPTSQQELGRALGKGAPAIVHLVDGLELGGHVKRTRRRDDRRRRVVQMTPAGLSLLVRADALIARIEDELFDGTGGAARDSILESLRAALVRP